MTVNNSTHINKTYNHLLPQTIKITMSYGVENPSPVLEQKQRTKYCLSTEILLDIITTHQIFITHYCDLKRGSEVRY